MYTAISISHFGTINSNSSFQAFRYSKQQPIPISIALPALLFVSSVWEPTVTEQTKPSGFDCSGIMKSRPSRTFIQ